jgi:hypothetical protein
MLNHFRTLLLNRSGSTSGFVNRLGEEFIPTEFRSITNLPNYVVKPRQVLFGNQPDWLFENYRVRQLLAIVHATPLAEYVTAFDNRITYDVSNPDMFANVFRTTTKGEGIRFAGRPGEPDGIGQSLRRWNISVIDEDTVRISQVLPSPRVDNIDYTLENGWSNLLKLGGNDFYFSFNPDLNDAWSVEQKLRPQRSLGELVANLEAATAPYWNDLFGVGTASGEEEPWKTFRNLWHDHPELPYRLSGFLVALVYRTEQRRIASAA